MKQATLQQLVLYRYRYKVAYALFIIALAGCLWLAGWGAPNGLTQQEQASAVASARLNINFQHLNILDLPYHVLQKASVSLLGFSQFAIKLPSLILGLISGIGILLLLRNWLHTGMALIASLIAITTGQFLLLAQTGTPTIMLFFWPIFLLLAAIHVARPSRWQLGWKILLCIAAALSLYTPLSIYILAMMAVSAVLHPHLRQVLRKSSKIKLAIAGFVAIILILPLAWHISQEPQLVITLLGLNDVSWSLGALWNNLVSISHTFLAFSHPDINPDSMVPLYGAATLALMVLGLLRLIVVDHHSARAYTLALWLVAAVVLLILQPGLLPVSFVPLILLLAIGINTLISEWYKLFPRNPYARISAILPLVILLGSIIYVNISRYTQSYTYSPKVAVYFSQDLSLVRHQLAQTRGNTTLIVPKSEQNFYLLLKPDYPKLTVSTQLNNQSTASKVIVAASLAEPSQFNTAQDIHVITNSYQQNGLRFYAYKPNQNVIINKATKERNNAHARSSKTSHEAKKSPKRP